jgi:hypothetical protein
MIQSLTTSPELFAAAGTLMFAPGWGQALYRIGRWAWGKRRR